MKIDELTVEVKCGITIDQSTAEACLKLVEIYLNSNPRTIIQSTKNKDDTHSFCFVDFL